MQVINKSAGSPVRFAEDAPASAGQMRDPKVLVQTRGAVPERRRASLPLGRRRSPALQDPLPLHAPSAGRNTRSVI